MTTLLRVHNDKHCYLKKSFISGKVCVKSPLQRKLPQSVHFLEDITDNIIRIVNAVQVILYCEFCLKQNIALLSHVSQA